MWRFMSLLRPLLLLLISERSVGVDCSSLLVEMFNEAGGMLLPLLNDGEAFPSADSVKCVEGRGVRISLEVDDSWINLFIL